MFLFKKDMKYGEKYRELLQPGRRFKTERSIHEFVTDKRSREGPDQSITGLISDCEKEIQFPLAFLHHIFINSKSLYPV
jgi:hypothetical protein